jgi:glycosyltransferase involved in cell wall biosynthesis
MLGRPELQLYFEDVPFWRANWHTEKGLFEPENEGKLAAIPPLPARVRPDAELRTAFPSDLVSPPRADKVCVFSTSEFGTFPAGSITDQIPLDEAHRLHDGIFEIVTSSVWSRNGYLTSGADPTRVRLIPLGVDPSIFYPPRRKQRDAARAKYKIADDDFVFLNIGAMTENKGIARILRAFCAILETHPNARLLLKGLEALYPSYEMFKGTMMASVGVANLGRLFSRLTYIGGSMSFREVAELHHAADCYVSPYGAEGFNLPALEAVASGLPLICTSGGPTDDFTTEDFSLRIRSEVIKGRVSGGDASWFAPDEAHLRELMERVIIDKQFRNKASVAGPRHVAEGFLWSHSVDKLLDVMFPRS